MTQEKSLTVTQAQAPMTLDYSSPAVVQTIRDTFAKGASPEEFTMFLGLCKGTGLNPFKKEIWFIKTKSGAQIMTGINGYYAIANNQAQYDGIETELVGEQEVTEGKITLKVPIKAVARVYRKDRSKPSTAEAYWDEYSKPLLSQYGNKTLWGQMPRLMLQKCAESVALRKAFPQELNGTYTAEEMPAEYSAHAVSLTSHDTHDTHDTHVVTLSDTQNALDTQKPEEPRAPKSVDDPCNTGALVPKGYWKNRDKSLLGPGCYPAKCDDGQFYIFSKEPVHAITDDADDTPEWMGPQETTPAPAAKKYLYDLSQIPSEKMDAVFEYLNKVGANCVGDTAESDTPLKRLEPYLMTK